MITPKKVGLINRDLDCLAPFVKSRLIKALEFFNKNRTDEVLALFEGFRTPFRQETLYSQSRTQPGAWVTDAEAWKSWHQYGLACDLAFLRKGSWSWEGDFGAVQSLFRSFGFETIAKEQSHIQITGKISIDDAYRITKDFGVQSLWMMVKGNSS